MISLTKILQMIVTNIGQHFDYIYALLVHSFHFKY